MYIFCFFCFLYILARLTDGGGGMTLVVCGPYKHIYADRQTQAAVHGFNKRGPKRHPFGIYGRRFGPVQVLYIYIYYMVYIVIVTIYYYV